jgi:hypothetical protein
MLAGGESDHTPPTDEQQPQHSTTTVGKAFTISSQTLSVNSKSEGTTQRSSGTSGSDTASPAENKGPGRRSPNKEEDSHKGEGEEEEESDDDEDSSGEEEEERDQVPDLSKKKLPRPGGRGERGVNMLFRVGLCAFELCSLLC